jgi:uncharacterized protein with HEPN domain
MIGAAELILATVERIDYRRFVTDRDVRDSILYKVVIIGEAAGAVPPHVKARIPDAPWADMKRMRNYVAHVYHSVNERRVWTLITVELPELLPKLKELLDVDAGARGRRDSDG